MSLYVVRGHRFERVPSSSTPPAKSAGLGIVSGVVDVDDDDWRRPRPYSNAELEQVRNTLAAHGQEHLLQFWPQLGEEERCQLMTDLR